MDAVLREWIRVRLVLVSRAGAVGLLIGSGGVLLLVPVMDGTGPASEFVFSIAALFLGIGVLGWAGTIMAGTGFENLQHHLGTRTDWSTEESRRAMVRLIGLGLGGMLGPSLLVAVST